ncbi:MAG: DUF3131 domain-containing protein [Pseudomonadota bacterium]
MRVTILACLLFATNGCGVIVRQVDSRLDQLGTSQWFVQGRRAQLNDDEKAWAETAWKYFNFNYNATTGLVNSADKQQLVTMWTVADTISATHTAHVLEFIDTKTFDERISTLLGFLNGMSLFQDRLPNRFYDASTGKKVDGKKRPNEVGWSAVDIGRLLVWLKILQIEYPYLGEYVDKAVLRWNFCDLIDNCGALYGGRLVGKDVKLIQEGRLGYEEYAALGYNIWGFDTALASTIEPYGRIRIQNQEVFYDLRDPRKTGNYAPVLTGPYLYSGLEFNWDRPGDISSFDSQHSNRVMAKLAHAIYRAQESRFRNLRIQTARTDHASEKTPKPVLDSIFADGFQWNTILENGEHKPDLALVATKAVFGMWALWDTSYTQQLILAIKELHSKDRGWFEGRYERSGAYDRTITASTNAMVLEAILYKSRGKLYTGPNNPTYMEALLADIFKQPNRCFPPERTQCDIN